MEIRKARPEDTAALHAIHVASIRDLCRSHYSPAQVAAWATGLARPGYLKAMALFDFFVAEEEGAIVGLCVLDVPGAELNALYVAPAAAGHGVGRCLLVHAEEIAWRREVRALKLKSTLNAVSFYERCGYRRLRRSTHRLASGLRLPCVEMTRRLLQPDVSSMTVP